MYKFISFLFLVFYTFTIQAQDIIHKTDDRIIAARVLKIDSMFVYYKEVTDLKGPTQTLLKSEVKFIKFDYTSQKQSEIQRKMDYTRAKNAVALGLGGTGAMLSIYYDRAIFETPSFFVSGRVGFGSWLSQTNINVHLTGNYNFGRDKSYLEFGLGGAVSLSDWNNRSGNYYKVYLTTPLIGYRLQPSYGFFLRTYVTAFFMLQNNQRENNIFPMFAVDLGYCF